MGVKLYMSFHMLLRGQQVDEGQRIHHTHKLDMDVVLNVPQSVVVSQIEPTYMFQYRDIYKAFFSLGLV